MERKNLAKGAFTFVVRKCSKEYKGDGVVACRTGAAMTMTAMVNRRLDRRGLRKSAAEAADRCGDAYPDTPERSKYKYPGQLQTICIQSVNDVVRIMRRGQGLGRSR